MKILIERDIVCSDSQDCWDEIVSSFVTQFPFEDDQGNRTAHLSISHEPHNHKIWIFFYDEDGKHESESKGQIITKNNVSTIKRATLRPANKNQIESLIITKLMQNSNIDVV